MHKILKSYTNYCTLLKSTEKYRQLPENNKFNSNYIDFSTNDYLGLSNNPILIEAAKLAGFNFGVGSTGSRLLSGNKQIFLDLEDQIAKDKQTEAAIIFNSGFQANISVLASLLDHRILSNNPLVFFDKLNHSSLYQAAFLSKAELTRYNHNDIDHLTKLLQKFENINRSKFIVTETIFGMDGDLLPIKEIANLAIKYNAFLYLDEAHATGIEGPYGYGLSTTIDLSHIPHVIMGTFSKALGCFGAYIATSNIIKNYIINNTPGFIYSTALSPMIVGSCYKAWELIKSLDQSRIELAAKATYLRTTLKSLGFNISTSSTHIIPIILGSEQAVIKAKNNLLDQKIIVSAIRPPTVPHKTSRLRIALNINHTNNHIEQLISALKFIRL